MKAFVTILALVLDLHSRCLHLRGRGLIQPIRPTAKRPASLGTAKCASKYVWLIFHVSRKEKLHEGFDHNFGFGSCHCLRLSQ
jgi:hypothetical protein